MFLLLKIVFLYNIEDLLNYVNQKMNKSFILFLCGIYDYLVSIFNNIILNMEKGTFWAIVGFMAMGIILSFTSMGIFLTKYN